MLNLTKDQVDKLRIQVEGEYQKGLLHVTPQRIQRRNVEKKLLPQPTKEGKVASRTLWRYMKLWMSITVLDGINVTFRYIGGNVSQDVINNQNKVASFDYEAMGLFDIDWQVKWNIGLFGLGCKALKGWDMIDKHPIAESINPLDIIPDPQAQNSKDMRFIGFIKRANIYDLYESDGFFGITDILERKGKPITETDMEHQLNVEAKLNQNNYPVTIGDDGIVDLYYHFVNFEGKKYLTAWLGGRKVLVKIVELEPKTKAQKRDPRKIRWPVHFFRSNPIDGLFFGASFWDEIGQFADAETILDNLELILARKMAMGEDKFINTAIVDINSVKNQTPGGRLIPIKLGNNDNINNSIFTVPQGNPGQFPGYVAQKNRTRQEETVSVSSLGFGVSPQGNQTKAEIQTLQQNMNTILSYAITMMMNAEKGFWMDWQEFYIYNLSPKSKKYISVTKSGSIVDNYELKKNDFIADYPMIVSVQSKQQMNAEKEQKFARFQVVMGTIIQNVKPGSYAFNELLREYMTLANLDRDQVLKFIPYTIDELDAIEGILLLEMGQKPSSPKEGQDFDTFINYYSYARDSELKLEIVQEYIDAKKQAEKAKLLPELPPEGGKVDNIAQGQVGNMLMQQQTNQTPSLQQVSQS